MTLVGDGGIVLDMAARRIEVVRRLIAVGMPLRAIEALMPGWEEAIAVVLESADVKPEAASL